MTGYSITPDAVAEVGRKATRCLELDKLAARCSSEAARLSKEAAEATREADKLAREVIQDLQKLDVDARGNFGWEKRIVRFVGLLASGSFNVPTPEGT